MTDAIACEWTLVTAPVEEPIALEDAKSHAGIFSADDNALINAYITAARQAAESYLNTALFTQTWKIQLSAFAETVYLPMAGVLQSVTSVQYYDSSNVLQTLSSSYYTVDTTSQPGCIRRAPTYSWPATYSDRARPVIITYVCGYADIDDIPEVIKHGIRLYVASMDADRLGGEGNAFGGKTYSTIAAEALWRSAGQVFWREPEVCR